MWAITSCVCHYKLASVKGPVTSLTSKCQENVMKMLDRQQLRPHSIGRIRTHGTYGNDKQTLMWFLLWNNVIITVKVWHESICKSCNIICVKWFQCMHTGLQTWTKNPATEKGHFYDTEKEKELHLAKTWDDLLWPITKLFPDVLLRNNFNIYHHMKSWQDGYASGFLYLHVNTLEQLKKKC